MINHNYDIDNDAQPDAVFDSPEGILMEYNTQGKRIAVAPAIGDNRRALLVETVTVNGTGKETLGDKYMLLSGHIINVTQTVRDGQFTVRELPKTDAMSITVGSGLMYEDGKYDKSLLPKNVRVGKFLALDGGYTVSTSEQTTQVTPFGELAHQMRDAVAANAKGVADIYQAYATLSDVRSVDGYTMLGNMFAQLGLLNSGRRAGPDLKKKQGMAKIVKRLFGRT